MPTPLRLIVTCEHASARVPGAWRAAFAGSTGVLSTHRAWDPGALPLARRFAARHGAPLHAGEATRLLVDLNRSEHHRGLHSPYARRLAPELRERALRELYRPWRAAVRAAVEERLAAGGRVLHLAVHTFTPVFRGRRRPMDAGLMFDPSRPAELELVERWRSALARREPGLRLQRNRPYRGTADGHLPCLRAQLRTRRYVGLQLELNQRFLRGPRRRRAAVERALLAAFDELGPFAG